MDGPDQLQGAAAAQADVDATVTIELTGKYGTNQEVCALASAKGWTILEHGAVEIKVPARVARMSTTIRDLLEALPDSDGEAVPLSGVPPAIFAQVLEFCMNHVNDHVMNAEEKKEWMQRPLALSEQDAEIVKIEGSPESLYPLMLAANYLDIELLLDTCSKKLAEFIKAHTPDQIYELLGLKRKFTFEEVEHAKADHSWLKHVVMPAKWCEAPAVSTPAAPADDVIVALEEGDSY